MRELGLQQERDTDYAMRMGNIGVIPKSAKRKLVWERGEEKIEKRKIKSKRKGWWQFWK